MKIGGEPVELVTDFSSLRAGTIVWIKPCRWDSSHLAHRAILIGPIRAKFVTSPVGAAPFSGLGFECLPRPKCNQDRRRVLTPDCVSARVIYRVVDRALDAQTTECKRETVRP